MNHQVTREDEAPRSRETAALARRLAVVNWFRVQADAERRSERIVQALEDHARLVLERGAPDSAEFHAPAAGRASIASGGFDLDRRAWQQALSDRLDEARTRFIASGRGVDHPLFSVAGEAVSIRPGALPIDLDRLWWRLRDDGGAEGALDASTTTRLRERTLWELGALLLWEEVGDLLGENPFLPLLVIYEEGLYPLDLEGDPVHIWAPGHAPAGG